jgi:hypothetical protein
MTALGIQPTTMGLAALGHSNQQRQTQQQGQKRDVFLGSRKLEPINHGRAHELKSEQSALPYPQGNARPCFASS